MDWIERADQFIAAANLADKRDTPAVALPHGDKRKLEVAIMMALEPHVFMFDEPTAGMSVDDVPVILDLIKALKGAGDKTILLVEHKMDVVKSLADRIVVLHNGRLVADGEPAEVIGSAVVQEAYLGVRQRSGAAPCLTRCSRSKACTPTSASITSCRASTSRCRAARMTVLLGRNGAGKTTTLRTIMGLWKPSAGRVTFDGRDIGGVATPDISRAGIAYVPETMGVFSGPHGAGEHDPGGAERAAGRGAARVDVRVLSGAQEILDASRPACCRAGRSRCCRSPAPSSSRAG